MSLHSHSSAPRQNKEGGERREHFGVFLIIVIIFIIILCCLLTSTAIVGNSSACSLSPSHNNIRCCQRVSVDGYFYQLRDGHGDGEKKKEGGG